MLRYQKILAILLILPALVSVSAGQSAKNDAPKAMMFEGQITNADAFDRVRTQSHQKIHFVKMVPGYTYTINMTGVFQTYLRIEDAKGKERAANDDFQESNSRIYFSPEKAGIYRVIATTLRGGATGFYKLTISPAKGAAAKRVVLRLNGELTKKDPFDKVRQTSHHRVHPVTLQAGKSYVIFSATQTYDGFLRLENSKRVQLASNDDYRDTRHSRMIFTPTKTAEYRIIVTTFGAGTTGAYSLVVIKQ